MSYDLPAPDVCRRCHCSRTYCDGQRQGCCDLCTHHDEPDQPEEEVDAA
jgi:hypothetical protein